VTRSLEAADRDFAIRRATLLGVVLLRRRRTKVTRWASTGFRSWMWKTIDRFSQGKGEATEDTDDESDVDDEADVIIDSDGEGTKGAHVKDDE
jgi:hypothetical protein